MWQFPRWQQGTKENVVVMASFCCKAILALTYVAAVEVAQAVGTRPLMWGTRPPWGITKYSKTHLIQIDWIYSEQETLTEGHNIDFMQISSFNYDSNSLFFSVWRYCQMLYTHLQWRQVNSTETILEFHATSSHHSWMTSFCIVSLVGNWLQLSWMYECRPISQEIKHLTSHCPHHWPKFMYPPPVPFPKHWILQPISRLLPYATNHYYCKNYHQHYSKPSINLTEGNHVVSQGIDRGTRYCSK